MDEPEPVVMPAFTFSPDGPTTITHPDGTVSVNPPRPDDTAVAEDTAVAATPEPEVPAAAAQASDSPSTMFPPESADPQPAATFTAPEPIGTAPEPAGDTATLPTSMTAPDAAVPADTQPAYQPPAWEAPPADPAGTDPAGTGSVVNPDGSITTRLPDGSFQTTVKLPGGATIVTGTTQPGAFPQPAPADQRGSRRRRGRNR